MIPRRSLLAAPLAVPLLARPARAQGWAPERPLRLVIPLAPGGTADTLGRIIAEPLGAALGQPVIIENRPGGATSIAAIAVARAAPDGLTMLYAVPSVQIINPHLVKNMTYDAMGDFAPLIALMRAPKLLVVRTGLPVQDVAELIALAKSQPGGPSYASSGVFSSGHLAGAMFAQMAGIELLHVPFRGTAPAAQELMAGRVDMAFDTIATLLPLVREGRMRALAVSTTEPAAAAPELPPIARTLPGYYDASFNYLLVPARTPPEAIARLNAELNKILASPTVRARFATLGVEPLGGTPEWLGAEVQSESDRWKRVIQVGGLQTE
ncbi:tripartite-type tricarboxylate transporter receptor subunit TctC [Humitalea rosea]|uniref:Tripartite-type tricarboxylate transporter receptor subunit TctC n=1 Tax=Humitalea rosea TaxID=990373 RepID=A0A2W7KE26_9PROT|nr:tripartite tricarboxylate transporter substrate-binding protein [Humitalea rosea]PZW45960.1 tripartite-type tricarboxylate transporter receptor subunit TctC [Humitalea rosea]